MTTALLVMPVTGAVSAQAAAPPRSSEAIALSVYNAPDPAKAVDALSVEEKSIFQERMKTWTGTITAGEVVEVKPTAAEQKALNQASASLSPTQAAAAAAAPSGCYSQYFFKTWKDLVAKTGESWMTTRWCSTLFNITSYSLTDKGGRGNVGISYVGLGQSTSRKPNAYNVYQAQIFKFKIGSANAEPCMHTRAKSDGTIGLYNGCNLS